MKLCFFVVTLLFFSNAFSQEVAWVTQSKKFAPSTGARVQEMTQDKLHNIYILYLLIEKVELDGHIFTAAGAAEFLLIKQDPKGKVIWGKQFGVRTNNYGGDIAVDNDLNIYITASVPVDGIILGQQVSGNGYVAKLNSNGELLWLREYGDNDGVAREVAVDLEGNAVVSGRISENVAIIRKYDSQGNISWTKEAKYNGCCIGILVDGLSIDSNNNIVTVGSFHGPVTFNGIPRDVDGEGLFIWKVDEDGNNIWVQHAYDVDKTFGVFGQISACNVVIDENDDIYVAGDFENIGVFGQYRLNDNDDETTGFITKISNQGVFLWVRPVYSGWIFIEGFTINVRNKTLSFCGYHFWGINYDNTYQQNGSNGFMITTDYDGRILGSTILHAPSNYISIEQVVFDDENNATVAGNFSGNAKIGCFDIVDGDFNASSFVYKTSNTSNEALSLSQISNHCFGDTAEAQLLSPEPIELSWAVSPSIEILSEDNLLKFVCRSADEKAFVKVTPKFECFPQTDVVQTFRIGDVPSVPDLPVGNSPLCPGVYEIYKTNTNSQIDSYSWSVSGPLHVDPNSASGSDQIRLMITQASAKGSIRVRALNACGQSEYSEELELFSFPEAGNPIITAPNTICAGQETVELTIRADDAKAFAWVLPKNVFVKSTSTDSSKILLNCTQITRPLAILGKAKGICNDYKSSDTVEIGVVPKPHAPELVGDAEVCIGGSFDYIAQGISTSCTVVWTVPENFTRKNETLDRITLEISPKSNSGFLKVFQQNECFDSETAELWIEVGAIPEKPSITESDCDRRVQFEGADEFIWYKNGSPLSNVERQLILQDSGHYWLVTTNRCGTNQSNELYLYPVYSDLIFIPDVITPNNDGKNDIFIIDKALKNSSIRIYNRWGRELFSSSFYDNSWSGINLEAGVYFYIINNACLEQPIKGSIHLLK